MVLIRVILFLILSYLSTITNPTYKASILCILDTFYVSCFYLSSEGLGLSNEVAYPKGGKYGDYVNDFAHFDIDPLAYLKSL
jgi:hypothetical protein